MRKFELLRYLKRWMPMIVLFFVIMTAGAFRALEKRQSYVASSVIKYSNEGAADGLAPDGERIDVSEIYSSANMARVMENLGLSYDRNSLDVLCSGITVTPIIEQQDENIRDAVNKEGEEYTIQPTAYIVSCTLDSSGSAALARNILNELLDVYFSDYSNKHINVGQIDNRMKELADTDYDFLEMVEMVEAQLADTVDSLHTRYMRAQDFRSVNTGYSFADLRDQFSLLREVDVPQLYALILGNQITKDRKVLINKYQNRIANYELSSAKAQENIQDILEVINSYVDKMRESGNTDLDSEYILGDVYEDERVADDGGNYRPTNRTVQYDTLLRSWVSSHNDWDYAEIDAAYCRYIISVYSDGDTGAETAGQEVSGSGEAGAEASGAETAGAEASGSGEAAAEAAGSGEDRVTAEDIQSRISHMLARMNELYEIVNETNVEYNEYLGAANIRILSSAAVSSAFNMKLYQAVIAVFFLVIGCCGAIVLGRTGDILEYLFLKDSMTGCMNRVSCDNYIQRNEQRLLSVNMCCMSLQITNQRELNQIYGRKGADDVLKEFGRVLQEVFGSRKNSFIAYNGSGQFMVFFEKASQENVMQEAGRLSIILMQSLDDYSVSYQMGAVNAGEEALFWIRGLISGAVKSGKPYSTRKAPRIQ
ncbi:MAG: GGDEF domain-containing protein [Acetatifactor sp.]|nr:GGDEF domain-containing protein [Acetatifactor sp.]